MRPHQTVFFVLALLLLSYGEVINMNNDSDSTQQQLPPISIKIIMGLKQNITMSYDQYLQKYKPEKLKKLNEFKNERQQSQYQLSRSIYQTNIQYINKFNQNSKNTYKMGLNSYTDIDPIKYKQSFTTAINQDALILKYGPLKTSQDKFPIQNDNIDASFPPNFSTGFSLNFESIAKPIAKPIAIRQKIKPNIISIEDLKKISLPARINFYTTPDQITIDWRNISGQVHFQGLCNACYAFAAIDSLYTTLRIRKKTVSPFSTQQIISCIKEYVERSDGCKGGLPQQVFYYIHSQGLGLQRDYPYSDDSLLNNVPGMCNKNLLKKPDYLKNKYFLYNYNSVELGDCSEVANLLKNNSLTGVLSRDKGFQFYEKGVFENPDKIYQINELNHAVAIVGYDHTKRAFIIKNSWDRSWGQNGFGYVHMNTGICVSVYYPIIN